MQELNYLTMLTAVRECVNKERLCVGIFTRTQANRLSVYLELLESMDEEEQKATHRAVRNANSSFIGFKMGAISRFSAQVRMLVVMLSTRFCMSRVSIMKF